MVPLIFPIEYHVESHSTPHHSPPFHWYSDEAKHQRNSALLYEYSTTESKPRHDGRQARIKANLSISCSSANSSLVLVSVFLNDISFSPHLILKYSQGHSFPHIYHLPFGNDSILSPRAICGTLFSSSLLDLTKTQPIDGDRKRTKARSLWIMSCRSLLTDSTSLAGKDNAPNARTHSGYLIHVLTYPPSW
ncbi:hypothetical protein QCA50_007249 [Cerrena zonata]|uniref:Uncharacterized protein n=1 Tax=Cerrena zonata TaxID=2478898 RepID=A0AAW0GHR3_9APHY